jgi:uncharacterized Zn ribbon protein
MSEDDKELIKQAENADDWSIVSDLKLKASSEEAKNILKIRMIVLYRKEEAFAGLT